MDELNPNFGKEKKPEKTEKKEEKPEAKKEEAKVKEEKKEKEEPKVEEPKKETLAADLSLGVEVLRLAQICGQSLKNGG